MNDRAVPRIREGYIGPAGERTWYRLVGDESDSALPLVMVHGGPGGCWPEGLQVLHRLAQDRLVVIYDQLGGGRSDDPADPARWTVEAFVGELERVRSHLGLARIHLYGWSWGAALAVAHARQASGVRSLTLASPVINVPLWTREGQRLRDRLPAGTVRALHRFEDSFQPGRPNAGEPRRGKSTDELVRTGRRMQRVFPLLASSPVQVLALAASRIPRLRGPSHQLLSLQYVRRHVMRSPKVPLSIFTMLAGTNGDMYSAMWGPSEYLCTGSLAGLDLTPELEHLDLPVLLTSGRHDEATPTVMEDILDHLRHGRWELFEHSAHCAIEEEPDAYGRVLADFLFDCDRGDGSTGGADGEGLDSPDS